MLLLYDIPGIGGRSAWNTAACRNRYTMESGSLASLGSTVVSDAGMDWVREIVRLTALSLVTDNCIHWAPVYMPHQASEAPNRE